MSLSEHRVSLYLTETDLGWVPRVGAVSILDVEPTQKPEPEEPAPDFTFYDLREVSVELCVQTKWGMRTISFNNFIEEERERNRFDINPIVGDDALSVHPPHSDNETPLAKQRRLQQTLKSNLTEWSRTTQDLMLALAEDKFDEVEIRQGVNIVLAAHNNARDVVEKHLDAIEDTMAIFKEHLLALRVD